VTPLAGRPIAFISLCLLCLREGATIIQATSAWAYKQATGKGTDGAAAKAASWAVGRPFGSKDEVPYLYLLDQGEDPGVDPVDPEDMVSNNEQDMAVKTAIATVQSTLEARLAELEAQLAAAQQVITDMGAAAEDARNSYEGELSYWKDEHGKAVTAMQRANGKHGAAVRQVKNLEADLEVLRAENTSLTQANATLRTEHEAALTRHLKFHEGVLARQKEARTRAIEKLQAEHEAALAELQSQADEAQARLVEEGASSGNDITIRELLAMGRGITITPAPGE
jgi:hypothetical protein